jgi:hypothetical protein
MRFFLTISLVACGLALAGCSGRSGFDGFVGRVTQNGAPVTVPEGSGIMLKVWHESGTSFLIPLDTEGKFKIGWMPIGKYSMMLEAPSRGKGPPMKQSVEGELNIEAGKTEYTIELGPNVKL